MRASSRVLSIRYLSFSTHQSERLCGAWRVHAGCCASAVRAVPRFARVDAAARDHIAASPRGLGLACGDASTPRAARARAAARLRIDDRPKLHAPFELAAPLLSVAACASLVAEAEAVAARQGGWDSSRHKNHPTVDMPAHALSLASYHRVRRAM